MNFSQTTVEYYLHINLARPSDNCNDHEEVEGIGQILFNVGRNRLSSNKRPCFGRLATLQACVERGFGYARSVKEMLKRGGSSIPVNNGYTE